MDLFKNLDITTILITILIPVIFASFLLKFDLYNESMYYEEEVKFYGSKVISIENINSGESLNKLLTFECDSVLRTVVMNSNELKNIKINDVLTFKAKRKNIATNDNKLSKDIQRYKLKCSIINCIFFGSCVMFIIMFVISAIRKTEGYLDKDTFNYNNVLGFFIFCIVIILLSFYSIVLI